MEIIYIFNIRAIKPLITWAVSSILFHVTLSRVTKTSIHGNQKNFCSKFIFLPCIFKAFAILSLGEIAA